VAANIRPGEGKGFATHVAAEGLAGRQAADSEGSHWEVFAQLQAC
jgi:hypothetical protein